MRVGRTFAMAAILVALLAYRADASSQSRTGASVAQARINGSTGAVTAFGGKGTLTATSSGSGGFYFVQFAGKYPKDLDASKVILQTTCNSGAYGVSNAYVSSASATEIDVGIYCWTSSTLTYVGNDMFVNVFVGQ